MNDPRRICLFTCLAVSRGIIGASDAATALERHRAWLSPGVATGPRPGPEALGQGWTQMTEAQRTAFLAELASLEADESRAEALVLAAALPEDVRRAWWGGSSGDVVEIDLDFAIGEIATDDLPKRTVLPRLPPEDRYEIRNEVARGGMGRVLLAKDALLGRRVAVKEMLAGAVEEGASPRDIERFLREARVTSQLEHPNIVPVHEMGQRADGTLFYTMKMVKGETMSKRLQSISQDRSAGEAGRYRARMKLLDAFVDVCQAMAYAHSKGVVNRDLKPSNVMLGDFGETVVLDWGLARVRGHADAARQDVEKRTLSLSVIKDDTDSSKLTMDGTILGTPSYMSPEQARGEIDVVDEKSDVYSLGAILYEIVTGEPPFLGETAEATVRAVVSQEAKAPSSLEPRTPVELEALILKALAKDRQKRLPSAKLLADEVIAFRDGRALSTFTYTGMQQVTRLVKRHRGVSIGLAAAAVALVAGTITSTYWGLRSRVDSKAARDSEQRSVIAAGKASDRAREAEESARRAEGLRLAAKARLIQDSNPGQAVWLAVRAAELQPGSEATSALYATLARLSERNRMYASEGWLTYATFSPDGTRAAAVGMDSAVRLWDTATGAPGRVLVGHWTTVLAAEFSPDGSKLLSSGEDGRVVLWDLASGQSIATFRGHGKTPRFAWSPTSRLLATWGTGCGTRLWNDAGLPVATVERDAVNAAFSPDGKRLALVFADSVEICDAAGATLKPLPHPASPTAAAWTPDGHEIVTTAADGTVRAWNPETGTTRFELALTPGARLGRPWISPDGTRCGFLAKHEPSGSDLVILRLQDQAILSRTAHASLLRKFTFSPDWKRALRTVESEVEIVDLASGAVVGTCRGHVNNVPSAEFSPDGRQIVTASGDWSAGIWDAEPGHAMKLCPGAGPAGVCDATDVEGFSALASLRDGKGLLLVDFRTGALLRSVLPAGPSACHGFFLDDGRIVAWRAEPASIEIQDVTPGKPALPLDCLPGPLDRVVARGPWIAAHFGPHNGGSFRVWDSRTGKPIGDIASGEESFGISVSPDGSQLIAGNYMPVATLFEVASGKKLGQVVGHLGPVNDAAWLDKPSRVLTSASDGATRILDFDSNVLLGVCIWPKGEVTRIAPSRNGRFAWIYGSRQARLFELQKGTLLARIDEFATIESISWSRDNSTAAFNLGTGQVRLVPFDPLPAARSAVRHDLSTFELDELEVGTPAERSQLKLQWWRDHPSGFKLWQEGDGHIMKQEYREAAECDRAALAVYPHSFRTHFSLAFALLRLGDRKGALAELRAALELGLPPETLDDPRFELDVLRSEPGWAEVAATRPPP